MPAYHRTFAWIWVVLGAVALGAGCKSEGEPGDGSTSEQGSAGRRSPNTPGRGQLADSGLLGAANDAGDGGGQSSAPSDGGGEPMTSGRGAQAGAEPVPPQAGTGEPAPPQGGTVAPVAAPVIPNDPGERGPWPVGVRTVMLPIGPGEVPVEIWYPAVQGSENGAESLFYDFIQALPPEAQAQVPAEEKPVLIPCNCFRDLPIDAEHGPYPASIFVHNFGAFRTSSVSLMSHWASRGFIVLAMDHPQLRLQDTLATGSLGACSGSGISEDSARTRDLGALLAALRAPAGDFAFLADVVDAEHVAVSGHSDGAEYAAAMSGEPGVRLIMAWNRALAIPRRGDVEAVAYFAGLEDSGASATPARVEAAFRDAAAPAMLVHVRNAGHFAMTELCNSKNALGRDGLAIATRYRLCGLDYTLLNLFWDCSSRYLSQADANRIFGFATAAALEQVLKGEDETASWATFQEDWGTVRLK